MLSICLHLIAPLIKGEGCVMYQNQLMLLLNQLAYLLRHHVMVLRLIPQRGHRPMEAATRTLRPAMVAMPMMKMMKMVIVIALVPVRMMTRRMTSRRLALPVAAMHPMALAGGHMDTIAMHMDITLPMMPSTMRQMRQILPCALWR